MKKIIIPLLACSLLAPAGMAAKKSKAKVPVKAAVAAPGATRDGFIDSLMAQMTLEEKMSQMVYQSPAIERLGIPAYNWWNEALHGVARAGQATIFPQAIGLGATFDTELLGQIADTIATEGRAKYNAYSQEEDRDIYKGLTVWMIPDDIRDLLCGHLTSIYSVIQDGDGDMKLTVKILTLRKSWESLL